MSDRLEPELERVAEMLARTGPLPDAPATLRERALAIPDGGPAATVTDIAVARRRLRRPRPAALLGIAAVAAAIVIVPTVLVMRDGGNQNVQLDPRPFAPQGGGNARIVSHDDGTATISLRVWKMPKPGAGQAYEAWLGRKGDRYALGTFGTDTTGAATVSFNVPREELHSYKWLWVTREPSGGSAHPSKRTALWGPIT